MWTGETMKSEVGIAENGMEMEWRRAIEN